MKCDDHHVDCNECGTKIAENENVYHCLNNLHWLMVIKLH